MPVRRAGNNASLAWRRNVSGTLLRGPQRLLGPPFLIIVPMHGPETTWGDTGPGTLVKVPPPFARVQRKTARRLRGVTPRN